MTYEQYQRYQSLEMTKDHIQKDVNKIQLIIDSIVQNPEGVCISALGGETISLLSVDPRINEVLVQALQKEASFKYQELARLTDEQENI